LEQQPNRGGLIAPHLDIQAGDLRPLLPRVRVEEALQGLLESP